jgi:hypothetical protein
MADVFFGVQLSAAADVVCSGPIKPEFSGGIGQGPCMVNVRYETQAFFDRK